MISSITIKSIESLVSTINRFPNNYIYRGQARAEWPLSSSLERVLGERWSMNSAQRFEDYALDQFTRKFHLYNHRDTVPTSKLGWLSLMQHHGVPTRLIDFTESPYVALYFALESYDAQHRLPFSLYALDYKALLDRSIDLIERKESQFTETVRSLSKRRDILFDEVIDRYTYDVAWATEPSVTNVRLDRQTGSFLLSGNREKRIEEVLASPHYESCDMWKLEVAPELYEGVFDLPTSPRLQ